MKRKILHMTGLNEILNIMTITFNVLFASQSFNLSINLVHFRSFLFYVVL